METLVLDTSYVPVARVHWQRALTLLFMGKVEVVEEYEDREIRSVTMTIKMPSIIRFLRAMKSKKKAIKFSRSNIHTRDKGICQYCRTPVAMASFTYDHVIPRAQGGKTEWSNVVVSCAPCNQKKGNRTPAQSGMHPTTLPVRPKKLPERFHVTLTWKEGMPLSWKDFLASYHYWNDELSQ